MAWIYRAVFLLVLLCAFVVGDRGSDRGDDDGRKDRDGGRGDKGSHGDPGNGDANSPRPYGDDRPPPLPPHHSPGAPPHPSGSRPGAHGHGPFVNHTVTPGMVTGANANLMAGAVNGGDPSNSDLVPRPFAQPGVLSPADMDMVDEPDDDEPVGSAEGESLTSGKTGTIIKVVAFVALGLLLLVTTLTLTWCIFKKVCHRHLKKTAPEGHKDRVIKVKVIDTSDMPAKPRQPWNVNSIREIRMVPLPRKPQNVRFTGDPPPWKPRNTKYTGESDETPSPWKPRNAMFTGEMGEIPSPWKQRNVTNTGETDLAPRPLTPDEAPGPERSRSSLIVSPPPPYSPLPDVEQRPEVRIRERSALFAERSERGFPDGFVLQVSPPPAYNDIFETDV